MPYKMQAKIRLFLEKVSEKGDFFVGACLYIREKLLCCHNLPPSFGRAKKYYNDTTMGII